MRENNIYFLKGFDGLGWAYDHDHGRGMLII